MSWVDTIGALGPSPQHHLGGARATERLLAMAGLRDGLRVLVVGCGDGACAIRIAVRHDCEVTGADLNPAAIERARRTATGEKLRGSVTFRVDDLLASSLPPGSFDVVLAESVLVMLPKEAALRAMRELLAPGGVLVLNEALRVSADLPALEAVEREFERAGMTWKLLSHAEWEALLTRMGFAIVQQTNAIGQNLTLLGVRNGLTHPLQTVSWLARMLGHREARRFFARIAVRMARARLRWGYCLWVCRVA